MDRLSRNAMLAREAGMTYGKWKALQPRVEIEKKPLPKGWKECPICGKEFKPVVQQQRYCDPGCRESAYKDKANAIRRAYKARMKKGDNDA